MISVVLPVHNGGPYLEESVRSVLSQSHSQLELILIDDRSSDDSIQKLDQTDQRLKIYQSVGAGVVNAFNTGLGLCKGDYIARMDADDVSMPQRLACQLAYLNLHPEVDIAGSCVEIFSSAGIEGGLRRYQQWLNSVRHPEQVHRQIFIESPLPNPGILFRRTALQQLKGYRDTQWPEDYDLLLRADAAGMRMGKPDPVLLKWREHEHRLTHTDSRYSRKRFMQAKAHFLVKHRLKGCAVIIWGAGPTGRLMHDLLIAEGGKIDGFIEVHPRRIGGKKRDLPVWAGDKIKQQTTEMVLVAVGSAGAREEIADFMHKYAKIEGQDYLFVA